MAAALRSADVLATTGGPLGAPIRSRSLFRSHSPLPSPCTELARALLPGHLGSSAAQYLSVKGRPADKIAVAVSPGWWRSYRLACDIRRNAVAVSRPK